MKKERSTCAPATEAELKWIEDFKKLAKRCPKKLWLFSGSGTLYVMKTPTNGEQNTETGGVNPDNILDTIRIENDGGDW